MSDSMDLVDNHGFASRVSSLVSLPLRRTTAKTITKWNGKIKVELHALGPEMPYGKMPRMLDAVVATLIVTHDPMWNPDLRRLYVGESFYAFAEHKLGVTRGGNQYKTLRRQLGNWIQLAYVIQDYREESVDTGRQFLTSELWHIKWLDRQRWDENRRVLGDECFIEFSEMYIKKIITENPVPVSFRILRQLNQIKSPLAVDIYLWLNRRMSYLHHPVLVTWNQLRGQFGSEAQEMFKFKQILKRSLDHVIQVWPGLNVTVSDKRGITLFPSKTTVPTLEEKRAQAKQARRKAMTEGHWIQVAGRRVYATTEMFEASTAIEHLSDAVPANTCRYCRFDSRNDEYHGVLAVHPQATDGESSESDRPAAAASNPKETISHFIGSPDYDPEAVRAEAETERWYEEHDII